MKYFNLIFISVCMLGLSAGNAGGQEIDREGGVMTYGEYRMPVTLDPVTSNDSASARIVELIFEGLVGFDDKGDVIPLLADWDISENRMIYTFRLKEGVMWHDGKSLTAEDVKFTYELIMHPNTDTYLKQALQFIIGARVIDERTIRFTLKRPVYNALGRFSFKILPAHKIIRRYLDRTDEFVWNPVGTGPYKFERVSMEGWVELTANENYHESKPFIERIIMRHFLDRDLMTESLLTNAIDVIPSLQPKDVGRVKQAGAFFLKDYNSLSYSFFAYNFKNFHLKNKMVRQALTMACNRQKMLLTFFQGKGKVISGPFPPGSYSYNPGVLPLPYDPTAARKLLRKAGYVDTDRDGIVEINGKPLKLALKANISDKIMKNVCVAYQDYLKDIGAEVTLEFLERYAWERAVYENHDFDIALASWVFDDAADITTLFHSGNYENNFINYSNPKVDQLLAEFNAPPEVDDDDPKLQAEQDAERRRSINRRLHTILNDEQPYTFLWTLTSYAAFHNRVRGVEIDPYTFFLNPDQWYIDPQQRKEKTEESGEF